MGKKKRHISVVNIILYSILAIVIMLPYGGMWLIKNMYDKKEKEIKDSSFLIISKEDMNLRVFDYSGHTLKTYSIACGKNYGNKKDVGDLKTPEGVFHVSSIEDAHTWTHDFGDGKGIIDGAYGPWFIRLEVPGHKGIGIHGTHKPESIGTRDTEGCIRLNNNDLQELKKMVRVGTTVVITPSYADAINMINMSSIDAKENESKKNVEMIDIVDNSSEVSTYKSKLIIK